MPAYQSASGPRTVELLGALCMLALEAEAERAFPGAVDDVAPDHADEAALTSGWGLHQEVAERRRQQEAERLSAVLATLQRLQEVWRMGAHCVAAAGAAGAAAGGTGLWSCSAAHAGRVSTLQQVLDSGLPLSSRPDAATGTAVGALLLGTQEQQQLLLQEGGPPSLAADAAPESVLLCLQLRLVAAVQRLQACAGGGAAASPLGLQAALADLQQLYGERGSGWQSLGMMVGQLLRLWLHWPHKRASLTISPT